jgi:outer membrane protein OmpA-like peptidoglycan-associated protein
VHSDYTRWVDTTRGPRIYNEGFTEYLARLVMSPQELSGRRSYADRLQLINEKVVPYASSDDIARAYFLGEVWRLEGRSTIATELFQRDIGLTEGVPRQTEVTEAAAAKGVVQEVVSGSHYRFMNFDIDSATPRPEHETYLRDVVIAQFVRNAPAARLQFVGHASSTGSPAHNRRLSQSRAAALYQLAARLGVPAAQLVDATSPPHQGEDQPTADNASVFGRALNRRVELFITHVTTP